MKNWIVLTFFLIFFSTTAYAKVVGQAVEYKHGDAVLEGYLAYDDSIDGKRPGVLIVHEWKGINDYSRSRAEQLAALGYVGFAVDMYGKGVQAKDHEEAAKLSGIYRNDRNLMRERAKTALETLKANPLVDTTKIAAIGYCFGGAAVLEMARAGFDLKGVASFHGSLDTPMPADSKTLKAKVRVFNGAADKFISQENIANFEAEMKNANADWKLTQFEGAVHSFTVPTAGSDPTTGMAYHADADKRSWEMLKEFLKEIF